jgi:hypothetical protein
MPHTPPLALEEDACYTRLMTALEATVEVFMTAYKALPKAARAGFLARLVEDREVREDLMDIAAIEKRRSEKARPFTDYLATHRARR